MSRPTRHRGQDGFTLTELLIGVVIGTIFMFAIYGFYDSSLSSETTQQGQVLAQDQARATRSTSTAASWPSGGQSDDGITRPIVSLTPTQIEFYADMSRSPTELTPKPQEFLYQVSAARSCVRSPSRSGRPRLQLRGVLGAKTHDSVNSSGTPMFGAATQWHGTPATISVGRRRSGSRWCT